MKKRKINRGIRARKLFLRPISRPRKREPLVLHCAATSFIITGLAGSEGRTKGGFPATKTPASHEHAADLLSALLTTADRLGIRVLEEDLRRGETPVSGGHCWYKGEWVVLLDRDSGPGERIEILVRVLEQMDLDSVYIPPVVRNRLHRDTDGDDNEKT